MPQISTADFKNGMTLDLDDGLCQVVEFQHVKPGTGGAFLSGPYSADLERAVLARVKPEIDRQIAAAEQKEADERARLATAEQWAGLLAGLAALLLHLGLDAGQLLAPRRPALALLDLGQGL